MNTFWLQRIFSIFGFRIPCLNFGDLVGKDTTQISEKGGADVWYKRVKFDGSDLTAPDTWHAMGYQEEWSIDWDQSEEARNDRSGSQVGTKVGDLKINGLIAHMQRGADTMTFLFRDVPGTYFALISNHGLVTAGKTLEVFIPVSKIKRKGSFKEPFVNTPIEFVPLENQASVVPASVPTGIKAIAAAFTTAAKNVFQPVETT
jgi:hypothetical protein